MAGNILSADLPAGMDGLDMVNMSDRDWAAHKRCKRASPTLMSNAPSPADDLASLLAEYERSAGTSIPHYRPQNEIRSLGVEAAENVAELHSVNGNPLPKPERIVFQPPPPTPPEPTFEQRIEPLIQPLREQVDEARQAYEQARLEADQRDAVRRDVERAAAAIRNVSAEPPRMQRPDPRTAMAMSDQEWATYKESVARAAR